MGREENVIIFQDTEKMCKSVERLKRAVKNSTAKQKLILEGDTYATPELNRYTGEAELIVSKKRSFEAASAYKGSKVCVHNFASASNPGGGVVRGSSAQEECLCRCSTLYFSLNTSEMWSGFYSPHRAAQNPIHNDDCIYTPDVVVFKADTASPSLMPEKDWYSVDVITCAAPNLREKPSNMMNSGDGHKAFKITDENLLALHEKRLTRILDIALAEKNEVIVLGAFGCGAFENKPEVVAKAAKNVIGKYLHAFKVIEFAVYCSPRDEANFKVFERVLKCEEQNALSYSAIFECMEKDAKLSDKCKDSFEHVIVAANQYMYYRQNWDEFPEKVLGRMNKERTLHHDNFILELNQYAENVKEETKCKVAWRVALTDDRHQLGEFAEYIINVVK